MKTTTQTTAAHAERVSTRDTEGEALADALRERYEINAVHYGEGHIEIRIRAGGTYAYVDVQDDGTVDVAYYDEAHGYPDAVGQTTHAANAAEEIVEAIARAHARAAMVRS